MKVFAGEKKGATRRLIDSAGRALYHGFIGFFIGFIPVFYVVVMDRFTSPHRSNVLMFLWAAFTLAYVSLRMRRERQARERWPAPALWKGFLPMVPNAVVCGGILGLVVMMPFFKFHWAHVVIGGLLCTAFMAYGYDAMLGESKKLLAKNRQTIADWVAGGKDESERARRSAYAHSKALLVGAAAAGVAEYKGAPELTWPAPLNIQSQNMGDCDPVVLNPSTGMPMVFNQPGGIDMGGNVWGSTNDD